MSALNFDGFAHELLKFIAPEVVHVCHGHQRSDAHLPLHFGHQVAH
jgi:hypothetical protein